VHMFTIQRSVPTCSPELNYEDMVITMLIPSLHHRSSHGASSCRYNCLILSVSRWFTYLSRYYRIFMHYYALSLRSASFVMVNSSWTKNHVDSILQHTDPFLDSIHYLPPLALIKLITRDAGVRTAQIVYPPCDTREMAQFSIEGRERVILSLAQFRYFRLIIHPLTPLKPRSSN
jgi:hypothetical protein